MAVINNIQPLRPYVTFTDKNGQLTKEAYDFLYSMFKRLGGSQDTLNAATLETHTWENPGPIGAATPNSGKFTSLDVQTYPMDGKGIKHAREATGTVAAAATVTITTIWTTPFPDANYTVACSVEAGTLQIVNISVVSATKVDVIIKNTSSVLTDTGTIHFIAIRG